MNAVVYLNCSKRSQAGVVGQSCALALVNPLPTFTSVDFRQI